MNTIDRLKILSSHMDFEPAEDYRCPKIDPSKSYSSFVHNAVMPNGKTIPLMKTLLTSACERDCHYCPFRAGRNFRRATLKPEELAHIFMSLHRAGIVEGLFLSSGLIGGGVKTQDRLLDTSHILRNKLGFKGYLHLKIMPGAEISQVEQAMLLADRVSLNLEAPNSKRLRILAPHKVFVNELIAPLKWVADIRSRKPARNGWNQRWPSTATQFVVGGAGENDIELLVTTEYLYRQLGLRRAYYSPFKPVDNTPLENQPATMYQRENRLYQASYLIRDYGFDMEELPFDNDGNLPQDTDPKLSWAMNFLSDNPIEINEASKRELLHIPGIGPKGVAVLVKERRINRLKCLDDLRRIGINPSRATPYITLDGRRPSQQLSLL
jgi:predicted DNA-binding helix-hairpin-helix protein